MLITCPSCGGAFETSEVGVTATVQCPHCVRAVVLRDARLVPPGKDESTVPLDPATQPWLEPVAGPATTRKGRAVGAGPPAGRRVSLSITAGPRKGEVLPLRRAQVVLGRAGGGAGADIEIDDPEVSRAHAVLVCTADRILLRDLGSRNGTFVGDERIESRELEDRSEFRLGGTPFLVILADHD